jgi:hypothetical protein
LLNCFFITKFFSKSFGNKNCIFINIGWLKPIVLSLCEHSSLQKIIVYNSKYQNNNQMMSGGINLSELSSCSDVDSSNHKNATHLAIVEEGENSDSPSNTHENGHNDEELSSVTSSKENLAANTKANQQSLFSNRHSSKSLNEAYDNSNSRRPSVVLQEILSTRRPSAIMASLRRGSHSILSPFRSKSEDPNDPARSPEAVEYRRKNRRVGE